MQTRGSMFTGREFFAYELAISMYLSRLTGYYNFCDLSLLVPGVEPLPLRKLQLILNHHKAVCCISLLSPPPNYLETCDF